VLYKRNPENKRFCSARATGLLKNLDIFLKKCQKCVKELKFGKNQLFNVFKAFSFLKFREVHFGSF
jgi:hypothetical protein